MKSAMHKALKNHMGKLKHQAPEGSPLEEKAESKMQEAQEERDGESDAAPEVNEPSHGAMHTEPSQHPALQMAGPQELGPEHVPALQALIDHLSNQGHPANSLEERAGLHAKGKMAAIMAKHKKV